jgi:hypothetical protein
MASSWEHTEATNVIYDTVDTYYSLKVGYDVCVATNMKDVSRKSF